MASCVRKRAAFVAVSPVGGLASSACKWTCTRPYKRSYPRRSSPIFGIFSNPRVDAPVVRCVASSPANNDDEDVLDENAMRAAEIHEVLTGLEEFRARIVDDATKLAKKVRASKKDLQKSLESHPDLIKIEGHVRDLEEELKQLGDR